MEHDLPRPSDRTWRACLIGAAVLALVVPLTGSLRYVVLGVAQIAGAGVTAWAVRRYRPALTHAWWLLAASALCAGIGQTYGALVYRRDGSITYPSAVDWLFLAHLVLIAAALVLMLRRRPNRPWRDALLDAAIGCTGTAVVMWVFIASPVLRGADQPLLAQAVSSTYGLGHLVVSGLAVWFRFGTEVRTPFARLLAMAVAARVAGNIVAFAQISATGERLVGWPPLMLWALWALLLPAAVAHPSARRAEGYGLHGGRELTGWLRTIAVLTIGCPVVTVAGYVLAAPDDRITPGELIAPVVLLTLLSLLLVVRASRSARLAEIRATQLDQKTRALDDALRQQHALQATLEHRALHDPLTGLGNRALLTERTDHALARPGPHALMLIDLDGFKEVNDDLGHPVGDELLVKFADRLRTTVPHRGVLARLGGDEFAVLLGDTSTGSAQTTAGELCRTLSEPYAVGGREVALTTSIGLLVADCDTKTSADALRDADLALYAAKTSGKNRVVVFTPELRAERAAHERLLAALGQAVDRGEFAAAYEPMVDLATGRPVAVETFIRWRTPEQGDLEPDKVLPVAEESGLIGPVGGWLLDEGYRRARPWYRRHGVAVAVDVSARQLRAPDFADQVLTELRGRELPGEALILEITEPALLAVADSEVAVRQVQRLRGDGVRIALDAFGTGSSSPAHLRRLPVDIVKLHPVLLSPDGPDDTVRAWPFVRAVLDLTHSLGMESVATGVSSRADLATLRSLGCRFAQGGAVGPRLALDDVERVLAGVDGANGDGGPSLPGEASGSGNLRAGAT